MALCKRNLVHQHLFLVWRIARRVRREVDGRVELEDLEGHGMEGLLQAAQRYRAGSAASFATFAGYRIRGAMYDALRAQGSYSRKEIAAWRAAEGRSEAAGPTPEPDSLSADEPLLDELAVARERRRWLMAAVDGLARDEKHFIRRMYFDGKKLTEAGQELGLSKSWASRVHARAVESLRRMAVSAQH